MATSGGGNVIVDDALERPHGVIDFAEAHVGDPAEDFAALFHTGPTFTSEVLIAYARQRPDVRLETLVERASWWWELREFQGLARGLDAHDEGADQGHAREASCGSFVRSTRGVSPGWVMVSRSRKLERDSPSATKVFELARSSTTPSGPPSWRPRPWPRRRGMVTPAPAAAHRTVSSVGSWSGSLPIREAAPRDLRDERAHGRQMSSAYGQLVPPGNTHHGALVAPKDPDDVAMRYPIGAMHLHPHVSELGDGVREPHQNNSRSLGGDRIDVMAADVEIDHVAPQFRGQPFQEPGRLLRRTMRSAIRPLFARIAISGGGRADGGSLGRRRGSPRYGRLRARSPPRP